MTTVWFWAPGNPPSTGVTWLALAYAQLHTHPGTAFWHIARRPDGYLLTMPALTPPWRATHLARVELPDPCP
jgi:hypothetical protein